MHQRCRLWLVTGFEGAEYDRTGLDWTGTGEDTPLSWRGARTRKSLSVRSLVRMTFVPGVSMRPPGLSYCNIDEPNTHFVLFLGSAITELEKKTGRMGDVLQ